MDTIDRLIMQGITAGVFPGAVVLVMRAGAVRKRAAYGHSLLYRTLQDRVDAPIPMTTETIFDLASVTKVVATTTAMLQLVDRGAVALDEPACAYLEEFRRKDKATITVRHLMTHTSGLPPGGPLYQRYHDAASIVAAVGRVRMASQPSEHVRYSDLGFIALGAIIARVCGQPLDQYVRAHILTPLGMHDAGYVPAPSLRPRIAPTEYQRGRDLVWGRVHDENADAMGGVAGHAGLFATVDDLAAFTRVVLDEGRYGTGCLLQPETARQMVSVQTGTLAPARGLGWLCNDPSFMGGLASRRTVGHTGFTGTSIVLDLDQHLSVILLTNRVHPSRNGPSLAAVRAGVASAAASL